MAGRYIYVIGVSSNPVKIGISDNVTKRRADLQIGCPDALVIHYRLLAPYSQAEQIEASCHASLADRRRHGEWFNVEVAEAIKLIDRAARAVRAMSETDEPKFVHDDVDRLISRRELSHQALAAIADYRVHLDRPDGKAEIARRNRLILLKAGPESATVFDLVAIERKSLIAALSRQAGALRKAEDALRRALIVLVNDHEYRRRRGLLDETQEKAA